MSELTIRYDGRIRAFPTSESVAFGRSNLEPGGRVGWGYDGRFIELGSGDHIHRVWGDLTWHHGYWRLRSLGSAQPVTIRLPMGAAIQLPAWTSEARDRGDPPEVLAVGPGRFEIALEVGAFGFALQCSWNDTAGGDEPAVNSGRATSSLGDELIPQISETEYKVLFVMATAFRHAANASDWSSSGASTPQPLSYSRIQRALGLKTERQATAAVERLVRRFRDGLLIPADLRPELQRSWVCQQALNQGVLNALVERYGRPEGVD